MERKLASIKRITEIRPIAGADAIECAIVGGGWPVVVKKGQFSVNELALFCEIDSFIPTELAPFLSRGKEPKEFNGVKGERLRTVKLRGQLSQGLLLSIADIGFEFHCTDPLASRNGRSRYLRSCRVRCAAIFLRGCAKLIRSACRTWTGRLITQQSMR